jgi:hypothetical protein
MLQKLQQLAKEFSTVYRAFLRFVAVFTRLVAIQKQKSLVHNFLFNIYFNIIRPSTSRSPK